MKISRHRSENVQLKYSSGLWSKAAILMALSNLVLAFWVVTASTAEKTIIVPAELTKSFWVQGDSVSPEYLEEMADYISGLVLTYNPANIDYRVKTFLKYADPRAYGELESKLYEDAEQSKRNRISSVFFPQEARIKGSKVALTGVLDTMVGSKPTNSRQATFLVDFDYRGGRLFVRKFVEVKRDKPFESEPGNV